MPKDQEPDAPLRTRPSLLSRLRSSDDPLLWEEFVTIYRPMIYRAAMAHDLTHHEAEDVTQDALVTIWKQIRTGKFRYDRTKGKFRGFVTKTTGWRIYDYLRKKGREPQPALKAPGTTARSTATIDRIPDPRTLNRDVISDAEWTEAVRTAAIERLKRKIRPKQFQIFDARVLKGWPVEKIVRTLGVSRTQVYLAKLRIARLFENEIKKIENSGL